MRKGKKMQVLPSVSYLVLLALALLACAGCNDGEQGTSETGTEVKLLGTETDYGNDGVTDAVTTYTYNTEGNAVRAEKVSGRDPLADSYVYTYNADGNIVREEVYEFPGRAVFRIVSHTYDSDGNVIRTETDDLADGTADKAHSLTTITGI